MSSAEEEIHIPDGTKIILPAVKVTEKAKKERTEAQKAAFEKMRAKRLENDSKRRLTKEESQKAMDEVKIQHEKVEEDERLRLAEDLRKKYSAEVTVQQKRGRKPGQRIPYGKSVTEPKVVEPPVPATPIPITQPTYSNPYMSMLLNKMRR